MPEQEPQKQTACSENALLSKKSDTHLLEMPMNTMVLNYHLMHPGSDSLPGDPNAAFYLDGIYHLHYILAHPWQDKKSYSFIHVTSPDMLHWTWQPTLLQPAFTGHGMFSGTGFIAKEGRPAIIYHGYGSDRNQIAIAKDRQLSSWKEPYSIEVKTAVGTEAMLNHWDKLQTLSSVERYTLVVLPHSSYNLGSYLRPMNAQ